MNLSQGIQETLSSFQCIYSPPSIREEEDDFLSGLATSSNLQKARRLARRGKIPKKPCLICKALNKVCKSRPCAWCRKWGLTGSCVDDETSKKVVIKFNRRKNDFAILILPIIPIKHSAQTLREAMSQSTKTAPKHIG